MVIKPVYGKDQMGRQLTIGRVLQPEECQKPLKVLESGAMDDLLLRRSKVWGGNITNIPRRLSLAWFPAWGYVGTGPCDLALNVLYHYSGGDENFAAEFVHDFVCEIVASLPMDEAICIRGEFISAWVAERLGAKSEQPGSLFCARFARPNMVWNNEFKEIPEPIQVA